MLKLCQVLGRPWHRVKMEPEMDMTRRKPFLIDLSYKEFLPASGSSQAKLLRDVSMTRILLSQSLILWPREGPETMPVSKLQGDAQAAGSLG